VTDARTIIGDTVYRKCGNTAWEDGRTSPDEVADAIIAALSAQGLVIVPVDPSFEMKREALRECGLDGYTAWRTYRAMLAAATPPGEAG